ncbi:MAG: HD-GYP domain-containing protein [Chloroflexi bacterium]|nr:MAG: HD-GYP domain-containing protein [Chloroflexota bacterium]MBL1195782.1 HD-GYP domain-containing protein [Chloroflexota bacterium]NOH13073.1 HD-GYP domain-containing protein [Chloroflexota bacterium]
MAVFTPDTTSLSSVTSRAELIVKLSELILEARDVPSAVEPILKALVVRTQADGAAYFQLIGERLYARSRVGEKLKKGGTDALMVQGMPLNIPLIKATIEVDEPLFVDETNASHIAVGFSKLGIRSLAIAPIRHHSGYLVGIIMMYCTGPQEWKGKGRNLFTDVAALPAKLMSRLIAEESALEAREGALRALGLALEYRDLETKGHTDRVTELALQIGENMGMGTGELRDLRWGAYLHDVGKLAIPDSILLKPGELDEEEWELMRQHPDMGYSFARQLNFLPQAVSDVVRYHHERWDGTGYPARLNTNNIPLMARIFSICDVYDALVNKRPYKEPWDHIDAINEIRVQAGAQFDPAVVEAFLKTQVVRNTGALELP